VNARPVSEGRHHQCVGCYATETGPAFTRQVYRRVCFVEECFDCAGLRSFLGWARHRDTSKVWGPTRGYRLLSVLRLRGKFQGNMTAVIPRKGKQL
jgi:hypothetical protein